VSALDKAARGEGSLTPGELKLFVELGLVRVTRTTADGRVTEYEYTHAARVLAQRGLS
jgi:hypothetical protein